MNRLLTIPISHFCEKARWALERAGIDYVEERHVQGIHRIVARRAGGGTTMPVLVTDEGVFAESEDILRYADDSTQSITVRFRDWCQPQSTPEHHTAIGPLSQRYRTTGGDGAQCGES